MTSRSDGMFAPLTEAERAAASTIQSEDEPGPVAPVPGDAPEPDWHKLLGCSPMATWTYRTANGAIAFHVARINRSTCQLSLRAPLKMPFSRTVGLESG